MRLFRSLQIVTLGVAAFLAMPAYAEPDASAAPAHTHHAHKRATHKATAPANGGNASFYSRHLSGHKTASGEPYDPNAMTAAHRTLPIGTKVKVVNPKNDQSVVVTVNDRGPVPRNRVLDVSSAAADALGMKKAGVTKVETEVVGKTDLSKGARKSSDEPSR